MLIIEYWGQRSEEMKVKGDRYEEKDKVLWSSFQVKFFYSEFKKAQHWGWMRWRKNMWNKEDLNGRE